MPSRRRRPEEDISITPVGVLGEPYTEGEDPATLQYPLTDEITGTEYALTGIGDVDLAAYVGQRVTIEGILAPGLISPDKPTSAFVNQIFPTGEPMKDSDGTSDGTLIRGTEVSDYLTDTEGNDTVYALDSGDTISSRYGDDALYGGGGNDLVYSADDGTADKVSGGPQYDVCVVGAEDTVTGGCEEVYRY